MDRARAQAALVAAETTDVLFVFRIQPDRACEYIDPSVEKYGGWTPDEFYEDPDFIAAIVDPRDLPVLMAVDEIAVGGTYDFEVRWIGRDGGTTWMQERVRKEQREDGAILLYGAARDISAHKEAEQALVETEELYRLIAENSLDVVYRTDTERRVSWTSPSVSEVLGWSVEEFVGTAVSELVHPDDIAHVRAIQKRVLETGAPLGELELRFKTGDGDWRWMRVRGRPIRDAAGALVGGIDVLRDIQREVEVRERLAHEADHDPLTGLPNRSRISALLGDALAEGRGRGVAVLAVGLDDLKAVNEALTYTAGDRVLTAVAERIVAEVGSRERVARVAGNEFAVIAPGLSDPTELAAYAMRLLDAVRGSIRLGVHELETSVSVGIAVSHTQSAESLLSDASLALHQAKSRGGGRYEFLDPAAADESLQRVLVRSQIREALAAGEIRAWFQPITVLPQGTVCGYEALVRWVHPDGTVGEPASFLPMAERTDLVVGLDRAVLGEAVALLARLRDERHVAVNVSAASLAAPDFAHVVLAALDGAGVSARRLHLEFTETTLVHVTDDVRSAMRTLAMRGVKWYVDDFGTGYSSITHLRDLPVSGIKLDRSFTSGLGTGDVTSERIAQALGGLAHGLELDTVAEGIETRDQAEAVAQLGWAHGQGWLYGRAVPSEQIR